MSEAFSGAASVERRAYMTGCLLVLMAGVAWSTAGIVLRFIETADGWQILFYRSAGLVPTMLLLIALRSRGQVAAAFKAAGWNAVAAGLCIACAFVGLIFGMLHTTVAKVSFILAAAPFLAAILGLLLLGEKVRRHTWLAMSLALGGVLLMVLTGLQGGDVKGDLFALLAAAGFAGFTIALRRGRGADMMPAVCLGGVFSLIFSGFMAGDLTPGRTDLALCLFLGVGQIGLGLALYTLGSRQLAAAELTLLSQSEVLLAPLWVWIGVGEEPYGATLAGGVIVLTAILIQALGGQRRARPPIGVA